MPDRAPAPLERRGGVERPAARDAPLLDELPADAQPEILPLGTRVWTGMRVVGYIGRDVVHRRAAPGDGVAAVEPLAEREVAPDTCLRRAVQWRGAQHRAEHLELGESPRDCRRTAATTAAREHHGGLRRFAALRHRRRDRPARSRRRRTGTGQDRRPSRRAASAMAGAAFAVSARPSPGVWRPPTKARPAPEPPPRAPRPQHARIDSATPAPPCIFPRRRRREFLLGLPPHRRCRPGETRSPPRPARSSAPLPQALERQRDLADVAPHRSAPAPVAARLLTPDPASAHVDRVALSRRGTAPSRPR